MILIILKCIDDKNNYVYFMASPDNATQLIFIQDQNGWKRKIRIDYRLQN